MARNKTLTIIGYFFKFIAVVLSIALFLPVLPMLILSGEPVETSCPEPMDASIMDSFDTFVDGSMQEAEAAALSVKKVFWIPNGAERVPEPDAAKYGRATDPAELQWLLDEAAVLLDGQETLFTTETDVRPGTEIVYYLDDSIFAVTWQQVIDRMIYTIAEVKISHPSQFRRYMADGYFGSVVLYKTTELSAQADAVLACSGDYFRARELGIVVYEGDIKRYTGSQTLDHCFIDVDGNMHLVPKGTFSSREDAEVYLRDNRIDFSFAFGPILVDNGVRCEPAIYGLGEVNDGYPRAALCQKDALHYLMVVTNGGGGNLNYPDIHMFADQISKFGVLTAYSLDGGQTGAIVMEDRLLNPTEYREGQRRISDMFFFATAIPSK